MAVKFLEYWDIDPEKKREYKNFILKEHIPTLNNLGITIVAAWNVLIGAFPQIISEGVAEDLNQVQMALTSETYKNLNNRLLTFVTNYKSKVQVPTGRLEHLPREIEKGTVKFNQYWDIIPGKEKEYEAFIHDTCVPKMNELGIKIAGEWSVLIGESPHVILEGRAKSLDILMKALQSDDYRQLKAKLMDMVNHCNSRVLVFHALRSIGYKSVSYEMYF